MDKNLFKYIFRYSKRDQIALLCITVFSFPFLYLSLDLPKNIVNDAISGDDSPRLLWGYSFTQLEYLWLLCGTFLALVFVNGGFKYVINIYKGILAERMLRRLRYMLIDRLMRFPMGRFRSVSQGEIVAMTTAETEAVGGFIGDAFALPAFQGGILLTILVFMFVQDPILGIAAIALYPIQAWLIPKLQRKVTLLNKERVRTLRKVSERLGETVAGVADIHANDTARYELADFSNRLNSLFWIRFKAYRLKFFIKFLNNFLAQLTPFFFYSIGGYLVIQGDLSFGALVAILAAYKDLSAPWKELLNYYQRMEDARIKYEQVVEGFTPPDIIPAEVVGRPEEGGVPYGLEQETDPARFAPLEGQLVAANLVLEGDETRAVDNVNFSAPLTSHMALTGPTGGGRSELARLMGRQIFPSGGKITIGARDLASLPETVTGRDIAYVDSESFIRSGSLRDALLYGLKHQPLSAPPETDPKILREAKASGN
ncbi:MAG: ABC transporter transmembrane domain-containing protein, partial [Rhodospirillaceae bacterium]